jgi:hypothetical protein
MNRNSDDDVVGAANGYDMGGLELESRQEQKFIFQQSRLTLGPIYFLSQWV